MASEASEPPVVVVLSGPSGAGKDTVLHRALELDASLATIATAKTRAPRPGERHGVNHVFLDEDEFDRVAGGGCLPRARDRLRASQRGAAGGGGGLSC